MMGRDRLIKKKHGKKEGKGNTTKKKRKRSEEKKNKEWNRSNVAWNLIKVAKVIS